jgi:hypothetical protein
MNPGTLLTVSVVTGAELGAAEDAGAVVGCG